MMHQLPESREDFIIDLAVWLIAAAIIVLFMVAGAVS